jgi:lipoprotein-anchoring transpeptidase ErfK/SrfK
MKEHGNGRAYSGWKKIAAVLTVLCLFNISSKAQIKEYTPPRDVKVIKETDDGRGNIIREIQYNQGAMRITEQIIMPKKFNGVGIRIPLRADTLNKDSLYLLVDKSKYCVQVYYRKKIVRAYKAVFGPNPRQNKCMEGDRCTPEGWFKIASKNPASKYNKFLLLNYPNDSAMSRFSRMKANGVIPSSAKVGGSVGIHGIWKGGDDMIEMGVGWTDGCVALKNRDVEDLYALVSVGTRVFIKK